MKQGKLDLLALEAGAKPGNPDPKHGAAATAEADAAALTTPPATVIPVAATIATDGDPALVETLSAARCQRELRCERVGPDKAHASLRSCREDVAVASRDELNRYKCKGAFNRDALFACMQGIQEVDCKKPLETLKEVAACKVATLCTAPR